MYLSIKRHLDCHCYKKNQLAKDSSNISPKILQRPRITKYVNNLKRYLDDVTEESEIELNLWRRSNIRDYRGLEKKIRVREKSLNRNE